MIHENMVNAQELRKDLIQPKKIQRKLTPEGLHQAIHYTCTLAVISRGEYLENK